MGIMGKTQGMSKPTKPPRKATTKNDHSDSSSLGVSLTAASAKEAVVLSSAIVFSASSCSGTAAAATAWSKPWMSKLNFLSRATQRPSMHDCPDILPLMAKGSFCRTFTFCLKVTLLTKNLEVSLNIGS